MLKESIHEDAAAFGMKLGGGGTAMEHSWETVRENVSNHIRSLNFKYRVKLREKNGGGCVGRNLQLYGQEKKLWSRNRLRLNIEWGDLI